MPIESTQTSLDDTLSTELAVLRDRNLERSLRTITARHGAEVRTEHGPAVDFSSNDYLGLATDPRIAAAAARATERFGTGSTASRLIAGNTAEHDELERELAAFFDAPAALSFSTGYAANTGILPALVGRDDVIFSDELNHASLIDGCRLSRAAVHVYPHADMRALGALLGRRRGEHRRAIIVTDGMFSMDGDLASLPEIVDLARRFDAWSYVDDAHAVGVLGTHGRGTVELLGVEGAIDILVGTLGKAFGAAGAFVVGPETLRAFLINRARSFIFSTGPMPAQAAAARAALEIIRREPALRDRVRANARHLRSAVAARGLQVTGTADGHIVPIVIGGAAETMTVGASLADQGFLVGAVRPPTVAAGTSRLRVTVSAAHTAAQIDDLVAAISAAIGSSVARSRA